MTEASGRKEELENYNHSLGLASKASKGCLIKLKRKVLVKTDCRLVCMVQIQDGLQGEMVVVSPCAKARKVKVCISSHRRRIMIHISMYDTYHMIIVSIRIHHTQTAFGLFVNYRDSAFSEAVQLSRSVLLCIYQYRRCYWIKAAFLTLPDSLANKSKTILIDVT